MLLSPTSLGQILAKLPVCISNNLGMVFNNKFATSIEKSD